jgi:hypothetical protein
MCFEVTYTFLKGEFKGSSHGKLKVHHSLGENLYRILSQLR